MIISLWIGRNDAGLQIVVDSLLVNPAVLSFQKLKSEESKEKRKGKRE